MLESRPTIVHVGRLVEYKRVGDLIQACGNLAESIPDLQLVIVGDGPSRRELERIAPSFVRFTGRISGVERDEIVAESHLQVVTSVREGWGLIVSEAACLGTPTLAYCVSGVMDSVLLTEGWLCPPTIEALTEWLPSVLSWIREHPNWSPNLNDQPSWSDVADQAIHAWLS